MNEIIFIEKSTRTVLIEKPMLGDTEDDFPNLFTYFYIKIYHSLTKTICKM